ncbi:putative exonuclease RecB family protein [Rhizobium phage RHph_TM3_14A]|nr:putative exonuclease RecB family protein [Rhizobium phage RHph_TM27A]QIG66984.1 putative exonuclease RecB family protein [Rhizobium phage RHph_TM27B]QIG67073.1 putative exonuclease RecB family protein [Rhizobium phage RHph_TM29]QIG67529.1 putative exonuclease RecB family protein [Rhizobium phage RHph_TM3_14A]
MRYNAKSVPKSFSFSYSKLKNFRTCPRRYHDIDVAKIYQENDNAGHLAEGNRVHKAFEQRISKGVPFPADLAHYEDAALRLLTLPGTILTEQQLAIREDLSPCEWFAKDAWYRGIADLVAINGPVAIAIDYKTGKIVEETEQLALLAECIFSHFKEVQAVRTEFWWLREDAATREDFRRNKRHETWAAVTPKVMELKHAHDTMTFPPKQNGLCRNHCIVTGCPFHGGGKK